MYTLFFSGAYVPLTVEGNIVVDRVLASCYGSFDHDLAHFAMTPIRWVPDIMEFIFGEEKGDSVYIKIGKSLGKWLLPFGKFFMTK